MTPLPFKSRHVGIWLPGPGAGGGSGSTRADAAGARGGPWDPAVVEAHGGTGAAPGGPRFSLAFEAPGYRWLWINALCTAMTFTVEMLSQGWLILSLTHSPFWVGLAAGVRGTSQALFSLAGGSLVDRMHRRALVIVWQTAAGAAALIVALLVLTREIRLWEMLVYLGFAGCAFAVNKAAVSALVYDVVGEQRLLNANAFQFMAGSLVRVVGAVAGGLIIARLGVGQNYLLVGAAYLAGAGAVLLLRNPAPARRTAEPLVASVRAGLQYAVRTPEIRRLLWLSLTIEAFGFSCMSMLPVLARDVLRVGAAGLGYLTAMMGVGQLAATVRVAASGDVRGKGTLLVTAAAAFGASVVVFGLSPWFPVSLALATIVGYAGSTYDATMSTVLQTAASGEMRGRVVGLYVSTFGLNQLGALGVGAAASAVGTPVAVAAGGLIAAMSAFGLIPGLRAFNAPAAGPAESAPPETDDS